MRALIKPFLEICLLRRGPQQLPASGLLLALALAAHALSSAALSSYQLGAGRALLAGITETALLAVLTGSLLATHRLAARVVQTLTALAGTGALIGVAALPLYGWLARAAPGAAGGPGLATLLLLGLLAWSLVVAGHILRHALSASLFLGMVIAVVFYWVSINVLNALFPAIG